MRRVVLQDIQEDNRNARFKKAFLVRDDGQVVAQTIDGDRIAAMKTDEVTMASALIEIEEFLHHGR